MYGPIEVIDEFSLRGEELEKQTYEEEAREFQEGQVEALLTDIGGGDGGDGGGGGDQAMEEGTGDDADTDGEEDDEAMPPTDPPVLVDLEVRAKTLTDIS